MKKQNIRDHYHPLGRQYDESDSIGLSLGSVTSFVMLDSLTSPLLIPLFSNMGLIIGPSEQQQQQQQQQQQLIGLL